MWERSSSVWDGEQTLFYILTLTQSSQRESLGRGVCVWGGRIRGDQREKKREIGGRRCWWMHLFVGSYSVSTTILQSLHHQLHSRGTVHANDQAGHSLNVCVCVCVYWGWWHTTKKNFSSNPLPHKQDPVCCRCQALESPELAMAKQPKEEPPVTYASNLRLETTRSR